MQLTRDITGISKIILIVLLLVSFIAGALFSYVYTMGYYAPNEFRTPEEPVMTIQDVEFSEQDARYFDVTVLNPSYSSSEVNITRIEARTTEDNLIHVATNTVPPLPFTLQKGESQTLRASWNWASYTGIILPYVDSIVEIRVFLQDGRGEIFETRRPLTRLMIAEHKFDPSISVNHFNLTVENLESSKTFVNITAFTINDNPLPTSSITPSLPYSLNPGDDPAQFQIFYNWTALMGQNITVGVETTQGYIARRTLALPKPVILDIPSSQIIFNATKSTEFNITVTNHANSSTYVTIGRITVAVSQQAAVNITNWTADPSSTLGINESILIACREWEWSTYTGQTVKITVYTTQGFIISKETQIP